MAHFEPCNLFLASFQLYIVAVPRTAELLLFLMVRHEAIGKSCSIGYRKR